MRTIIFKVTSWRNQSLWRRIECTHAQTLHDLHQAIQSAFNLDDDHLYAFFLNNRPWDQAFDYGGPGVTPTPRYATDAVLAELPLKINKRILYIFDFGDDLRYDVKVDGEGLADPTRSYPRVVDGEGEALPQYQSLDEDAREHQQEDDEGVERRSTLDEENGGAPGQDASRTASAGASGRTMFESARPPAAPGMERRGG